MTVLMTQHANFSKHVPVQNTIQEMVWQTLLIPYFRANLPFLLPKRISSFVQRSKVPSWKYGARQTSTQLEVDMRQDRKFAGWRFQKKIACLIKADRLRWHWALFLLFFLLFSPRLRVWCETEKQLLSYKCEDISHTQKVLEQKSSNPGWFPPAGASSCTSYLPTPCCKRKTSNLLQMLKLGFCSM